jgi:hypothetical protein
LTSVLTLSLVFAIETVKKQVLCLFPRVSDFNLSFGPMSRSRERGDAFLGGGAQAQQPARFPSSSQKPRHGDGVMIQFL